MSRPRVIAWGLMLLAFALASSHFPLQARERDEAARPSLSSEDEHEDASRATILGLAGVHHAVARGTVMLFDNRGRLVERLDPKGHRAGYFELPLSERPFARLAGEDDKLAFRIVLRNGIARASAVV